MTIQLRVDPEAAALLEVLTSPYGKGRLISGLLQIAGERWQAIEKGQSVPMDRLSHLLMYEQHQRADSQRRSAKAAKRKRK